MNGLHVKNLKKIHLGAVVVIMLLSMAGCSDQRTMDFASKTSEIETKTADTETKTNVLDERELGNNDAVSDVSINREKWEKRMAFPTEEEIESHYGNNPTRAPYVAAWMAAGSAGRFDQYVIDFKADFVPDYTYCCLANFILDYSALNDQYASVSSDGGINGYAGFQYRKPGTVPIGIMSIWDLYCYDKDGQKTTIRATRVYPGPDADQTFTGEGDGVHCLTDYDWKAGKWYRMLLKLDTSESTGNTTIEQQVMDLETEEWTLLSKYDLGVKNVAFVRDVAIFLENYKPSTSADVRTMEVRGIRIHPEGSEQWIPVNSGRFSQSYNYAGSYAYGTDEEVFWMISTGIEGKAGGLAKATVLTLTDEETTLKDSIQTENPTASTILQKGCVSGREYSLTLDLAKWEGHTSEEQLEMIQKLFWEVYPRMYERFGVLSGAPTDVTIAIEAEGYEIAWALGDYIHLRDEWLGTYKEDYDCLTHELAHVIQNGWDGEYLEYDAFIERFADYCRFLYAYQDGKYNDAVWTLQTVRDESSIETSVRFLVWLDYALAYQKDVMRDYFVICTERKYPAAEWDQAWQEIFRGTWLEGKSVEEAWECFAASDFAMLSSVRNGDGPSDLLREYDVRTKLLGSR